MNEMRTGWLAGFLDSGGGLRLFKERNNRYRSEIKIQMADKAVVEAAVSALAEIGIPLLTISCLPARNSKHRDQWGFTVSNVKQMYILASAMEKASLAKRDRWRLIRQFNETRLYNFGDPFDERHEQLFLEWQRLTGKNDDLESN